MAEEEEEKKDDEEGGGVVPPVATLVKPIIDCVGEPVPMLEIVMLGLIGANLGPFKPMIDILTDPLKIPTIAVELPKMAVDLPGLILGPLLQVPDLPAITIPAIAPFPEISIPGPPGFGLSLGMLVIGMLLCPLDICLGLLEFAIPTPDMVIDLLLKGIGIPSIGVLGLIECLVPVLIMIFLLPVAFFP